ncbi:RNA polymerase subunit sigma-70 [Streptomyces sp. NBC_01255]|uniref:sigma factor-like helix-turn-helix DNA-binding protein n=1 Tax=Streptomyces sp. NBC_01255 TaxID=2903798 RepID=UPI002E33E85F|nr:sigma factor-like helix-turn-helix DNA-binding protein [Streptomyces sp. NBC_01255]
MHDDTLLTALTRRFDADQEQLRGVALRMMGSRAEAEDVLATARAELARDSTAAVRAWLAAHVGQACVRGLRERAAAGRPGPGGGDPDGVGDLDGVGARGAGGVDSVWLALLVALETLGTEERLAYVLHDLFGLPPDETARVTGGSPVDAARLARRARERLRGGGTARTDGVPGRQRAVADRFLAAARARDARALAAVLTPDVVAYSARGPVHGAPAVAEAAAAFARLADAARPALVDGSVGLVAFVAGVPVSAVAFALRHDRIVALDIVTGEDRVRALDLAFPDG